MIKPELVIDGNNFSNLLEFFEEFRKLTPDKSWGNNLDAFDDVVRGGFGTPEEGYTLIWKNSEVSKARLGYPETIRVLEKRLSRAHPSAHKKIENEIALARQGVGPTVFDWLVDAIRRKNVSIELVLECSN